MTPTPFLKDTDSLPKQPERPMFRVVTSAGEAEEHLRVIRQTMERSTRHSTLSGLSGVLVGLYALIGSALTWFVTPNLPDLYVRPAFIGVWAVVGGLSLLTDIAVTKRQAAQVGKTPLSPLGKHLIRAAAPGIATGIILSGFYLMYPKLIREYIYGVWMLCYATALLSVGMFSVREVSVLGWAFLAAGGVTLLMPAAALTVSGIVPEAFPAAMMAVTFGGFHIWYGCYMGRKYGW